MKTHLYTKEPDKNHFVAEVDIPDFVTGPPDVLIWGDRVFTRTTSGDIFYYTEAFAYVVVT